MTGLSTMTLLSALVISMDAYFDTLMDRGRTSNIIVGRKGRQTRLFTTALKERLTELEEKASKYDTLMFASSGRSDGKTGD